MQSFFGNNKKSLWNAPHLLEEALMNKIVEFNQTKNKLTLKFETPPCRRTIFLHDKTKYFLSFPTMCFNVKIEKYCDYQVDVNNKEYIKELK